MRISRGRTQTPGIASGSGRRGRLHLARAMYPMLLAASWTVALAVAPPAAGIALEETTEFFHSEGPRVTSASVSNGEARLVLTFRKTGQFQAGIWSGKHPDGNSTRVISLG